MSKAVTWVLNNRYYAYVSSDWTCRLRIVLLERLVRSHKINLLSVKTSGEDNIAVINSLTEYADTADDPQIIENEAYVALD